MLNLRAPRPALVWEQLINSSWPTKQYTQPQKNGSWGKRCCRRCMLSAKWCNPKQFPSARYIRMAASRSGLLSKPSRWRRARLSVSRCTVCFIRRCVYPSRPEVPTSSSQRTSASRVAAAGGRKGAHRRTPHTKNQIPMCTHWTAARCWRRATAKASLYRRWRGIEG